MKRVALALVILSVSLSAQAPPPGGNPSIASLPTRSIAGRVVAEDTGDPIANARVSVFAAGQGARVVLTDHEGRFTVTVPLGRVALAVNKSGFSRGEIRVNAEEQSSEIRLSRGAAISGRVIDALGDPIVGARVTLEAEARPTAKGFAGIASTETDDLGEYRLGSLKANTVRVMVGTPNAAREVVGQSIVTMNSGLRRTYYPGVPTPDEAGTLQLHAGEERSSIDIAVGPNPNAESMVTDWLLRTNQSRDSRYVGAMRDPASSGGQGTGVIRGRVVSTDGRPVPHAQVETTFAVATSPSGSGSVVRFAPVIVTADDDGRFELAALHAGAFGISARKTGYSMPDSVTSLGAPALNPRVRVDLAEGETRERVDIRLARWGTLSGHVFDELGDPMEGASVQLLQVRYQAGRRRLVPAAGGTRTTDDLGRFRTYGLPPGQYIISAAVGAVLAADIPGYTRSYFPGTPTAGEAQFVAVGLSQDVASIDFSMSRARTARISGTMLDAAGVPSTGGSVKLVPSQRSSAVTSVPVGARILSDGRFEFPNVTSGQYVIQVDHGRKRGSIEGEFGTLPVAVDGTDVTGLVVQTSAGSSITGHFTFDASRGTKTPGRNQIELTPVPIDADQSPALPANAEIRDDWSFEIHGINGPRRLQLQRVPSDWALKEIRVRQTDVTDRALPFGTRDQSLDDVEVVLTDRINEVRATIADDQSKPAPRAHVIVFASDRDRWYPNSRFMRHAVAGSDGTIALAGLPPGSYSAVAVTQVPNDGDDAWTDPAFLETLTPWVTNFTLGDGQKQVLNLKLSTGMKGR